MRHQNALSWIKDRLNPQYRHTRCPLCLFVIDVDSDGRMDEHGSGTSPCKGSGRVDTELARDLDAGARLSVAVRGTASDGAATH